MNINSHAQADSQSGNLEAENGADRKGPIQLRSEPSERFECLAESEPHQQLKAALSQIDALLRQNTRLKRCLVAMAQAFSEPRHFPQAGELKWYPNLYLSSARLNNRDLREDPAEHDLDRPD